MSETALVVPTPKYQISPEDAISSPEYQALFGLHNRDYPSLRAASRLADIANRGSISADRFYRQVLEEAWKQGAVLSALQKQTGLRTTALFPTNPEKRKSAETAFRAFALGSFKRDVDGRGWVVAGPLFDWRLAVLEGDQKNPCIALTPRGSELIEALAGPRTAKAGPGAVQPVIPGHRVPFQQSNRGIVMSINNAYIAKQAISARSLADAKSVQKLIEDAIGARNPRAVGDK